jgi:hypothetical protein
MYIYHGGNPSMLTTVTGEGIGTPNFCTGCSGHDNSIAYTTNDPSIFFLMCTCLTNKTKIHILEYIEYYVINWNFGPENKGIYIEILMISWHLMPYDWAWTLTLTYLEK